ncbi:MAG: segregation/condensation protein A [Desulfuromonas sp.]|nr:MAG: segregation/condensation protein A [Desulfuromonas sp.]
MAYEIKIENFEGPLDLLLHLIKKNEMDIYDIQVAAITDQYLSILDAMKSLNLDVAGEFLLMAATLLHIKSKLLLPVHDEEEGDEEELDPRAELVRRLLEYQKYKEAGAQFDAMPRLQRDVFARKFPARELVVSEEGEEMIAVGIFELVDAFQKLLKETSDPYIHEVNIERLTVADRINSILSLLSGKESLSFLDVFEEKPDRSIIVVTFLAMLELVRLRMVRLMQNSRCGNIWLYPAVIDDEISPFDLGEESLGYI